MRAFTVGAEHLDIVVPEDSAARHMARLSLARHGVIGSLPGLLALQVGGKRHCTEQELVSGAFHQHLAVFQIAEAPRPGDRQLLERLRRFDGLAAQARDFRHDQDLERRARLEDIHQP